MVTRDGRRKQQHLAAEAHSIRRNNAMADAILDQLQAAARAGAAEALKERDSSVLHQALSGLATSRAADEIELWRAYRAREVAELIGLSASRVYDIPERELRPTWIGPNRGSKRFLGINVIAYMTGIEPVDVEAVAASLRERFMRDAQQPTRVRPMQASGKQRVL